MPDQDATPDVFTIAADDIDRVLAEAAVSYYYMDSVDLELFVFDTREAAEAHMEQVPKHDREIIAVSGKPEEREVFEQQMRAELEQIIRVQQMSEKSIWDFLDHEALIDLGQRVYWVIESSASEKASANIKAILDEYLVQAMQAAGFVPKDQEPTNDDSGSTPEGDGHEQDSQ